MKALERLHPNFYPIPGRQVLNESGKVVEVELVHDPHLTKRELRLLYGECGNYLHRGSIEQIMKGRALPKIADLDIWKTKIIILPA